MDAILTAGGIPNQNDPLYEYTQGNPKALLDLAGKPMAQWVLDALSDSHLVERVVLVGLTDGFGLSCTKPLTYLSNQGGMLENIFAGVHKVMELNPDAEVVLTVSSDIPAITGEMLDWMITEIQKAKYDIYYNVLLREDMEKRFPGSNRSYTRLKDMEVCGGDLTAFRTELVTTDDSVWQQIIAARKSVFRQAALIGFDTLALLLFRRLTLKGAIERVGKSLNIRPRAIVCPYPEIGMDVDKPYQMDILHAELAQQVAL